MNINDIITESQHKCPHCGGPLVEYSGLMEKKDACYYKVKASAKVWPSAYASGRLVQCRKKGAGNYGNKSESVAEGSKDSAPKMGSKEKKLAQGALKGARDMSAVLGLVRGKDGVAKPPETKKQSVAEGVAETVPMDQAKKVLGHYGADHFKTTTNELHFYKNGRPMSVDLIFNYDDATRSVSLSQLNSATRRLKGQGMAEESYIIVRTDTEGKQDVFAKFSTYEKAQNELNDLLDHPLHTKYKQKFELRRKGQQGVAEAQLDEKCWDGYQQQGMKNKSGRQVPNCVPVEEDSDNKCPPATQDIELNLKNRQKAINEYGYGPLNPDMPNAKFWMKKVDEWNLDSAEEAKQSLCGNCAAFDVRESTLDCIAQGIDSESPEDAAGVIDAGDLGYCKFLKFKCASRRTCDAWVTGGPLTDEPGVAEVTDPEIEEMYEAMEQLAEEIAAKKGVSVDLVWESFEALDDHMLYETAAWRRKEGKSARGGLNAKGVASYRRENPGSKLQTAVTTKPSKLKPGSKAAKRRKSFCARMGGVKGPMKKPNGKPTRKALALRKWNC